MTYELTQCPNCKLFVSLRGYDYHIMRCGDTIDKIKTDYLAGDIGKDRVSPPSVGAWVHH